MSIARGIGQSSSAALYEIADDQLAVGSTLGGPKVAAIIKANGSIEKVFSVDSGEVLLGTFIQRHYDAITGMCLEQGRPGTFLIHPEHQEHHYALPNNVTVIENIFVLNSRGVEYGKDEETEPPAVYELVRLTNDGAEPVEMMTYAYIDLRGETAHDMVARYDTKLRALVARNRSKPGTVRIIGCSVEPESYETTLDYAKAIAEDSPRRLSNTTDAAFDPLGALEHCHRLKPGESVEFAYLISIGADESAAKANYRASPPATEALRKTRAYYADVLSRSVVLTPDPYVNRGVLWAKANMLRVESKAPTGWCFTNDPTRSNNSVGRDTAWFAFGADYVTPEFARESLREYVKLQDKNGKVIEYYDIRNGKTEDYGLNINDNTPLLIISLWHHYNVTGNEEFLREVYPAAVKAAKYILSQRNEQGLVWCTATGTSDWGIVGWRNVIPNYRLSGATTEVNSECFAALETASQMARKLEKHEESAYFADEAARLKEAINTHLYNPNNGLYYLNIDLEGNRRTDITSDLVFPVMFGVAPDDIAANIIGRLSNQDFWTDAGIRTTPRDAPNYTPNGGWGLLGGVWVGVSFWYAFAAARHSPEFMAHALSVSFRNYSSDPRRNNTVPGQFSEWLHGETLVNEGMMLSPWFPPRYVWAAIEGVAGLDLSRGDISVCPRLAPDWKWLAVQNLPYRGKRLTWFAARMPETRIYTNFVSPGDLSAYVTYETDISSSVRAAVDSVCTIGLKQAQNVLLFAGNTDERTVTTSLRLDDELGGLYRLRRYDSLLASWVEEDQLISGENVKRGLSVKLERKGFAILELKQEV